jgi:hypothetical protein
MTDQAIDRAIYVLVAISIMFSIAWAISLWFVWAPNAI